MKTNLGSQYNLMQLKKATKTLNDNKHNGENTYTAKKFNDNYIVSDYLGVYTFTMFEAIAIANEYNRR